MKGKVQLVQKHDKISSCAPRNSGSSWSTFNLVVLKAALICWEAHLFSLRSCEQRRIYNFPDIGSRTPIKHASFRNSSSGGSSLNTRLPALLRTLELYTHRLKSKSRSMKHSNTWVKLLHLNTLFPLLYSLYFCQNELSNLQAFVQF